MSRQERSMLNVKFYRCVHCGNIIVKVKEARVAISEEMARKIMI